MISKFVMALLSGMITVSAVAQAPSVEPAAGVRSAGDRNSPPRSGSASNIVPADTQGTNAPTLPASGLSRDATSHQYLSAARASLAAGRTGEAQQALEMAETRALAGSASPEVAKHPGGNPKVTEIRDALHALGNGDSARAIQIIDIALNN